MRIIGTPLKRSLVILFKPQNISRPFQEVNQTAPTVKIQIWGTFSHKNVCQTTQNWIFKNSKSQMEPH